MFDKNHQKELDKNEFKIMIKTIKHTFNNDLIPKFFNAFDSSKDGKI